MAVEFEVEIHDFVEFNAAHCIKRRPLVQRQFRRCPRTARGRLFQRDEPLPKAFASWTPVFHVNEAWIDEAGKSAVLKDVLRLELLSTVTRYGGFRAHACVLIAAFAGALTPTRRNYSTGYRNQPSRMDSVIAPSRGLARSDQSCPLRSPRPIVYRHARRRRTHWPPQRESNPV